MKLMRRWALNRADLVLGVAALAAASLVAAIPVFSKSVRLSLLGKPDFDDTMATALLAAWVTIFLAGVGAAIKITSTRQNLTSLFTSEIRALQFGLSTMEMFAFWSAVYQAPRSGGFGFADVPRDEDYFQTFHSVTENVGNLHPRTVEALVRFYTYLKMSRDAAAALHSWREGTDDTTRRVHVVYVIQLLGLSMLWGFVALEAMGCPYQRIDKAFLDKIHAAYDVLHRDAPIPALHFPTVFREHPRHRELCAFFFAGRGDIAERAAAAAVTA